MQYEDPLAEILFSHTGRGSVGLRLLIPFFRPMASSCLSLGPGFRVSSDKLAAKKRSLLFGTGIHLPEGSFVEGN